MAAEGQPVFSVTRGDFAPTDVGQRNYELIQAGTLCEAHDGGDCDQRAQFTVGFRVGPYTDVIPTCASHIGSTMRRVHQDAQEGEHSFGGIEINGIGISALRRIALILTCFNGIPLRRQSTESSNFYDLFTKKLAHNSFKS